MLSKEEIKPLFEDKQYLKVLQDAGNNPYLDDYLGFLYLETGNYDKAEKFFEDSGKLYQQGFCKLLQGDKASARKIWYSAQENSAIIWGKVLLGILDYKLEAIPTFLQVRNFAESTLHYLFKANQTEFAHKLIGAKEFLADCNIETYKYFGRVFIDNNLEDLAFDYLQKAIDVIPQDYEAYFHLGDWYLKNKNIAMAKKSYKRVLEINPYHTPAAKILEKIQGDIIK